jgi:hypothetical protein
VALGTGLFSKKNKNPLFADGPSAKKVSKTVNLPPPLTATFFG